MNTINTIRRCILYNILQGLSEAAAKYSAASGKMVFVVSPKTHDAQEKQVRGQNILIFADFSELSWILSLLLFEDQSPKTIGL